MATPPDDLFVLVARVLGFRAEEVPTLAALEGR